MTVKDSIAKVLLWGYIKVKGIHRCLGGTGHGMYICGIKPWDPPDPGPWEGICSPRVCHQYDECMELFGEDLDQEEKADSYEVS